MVFRSIALAIALAGLAACSGMDQKSVTLPDGSTQVTVTTWHKQAIGPNTQVDTVWACAPHAAHCGPVDSTQGTSSGPLDLVPAVAVGGGLGVVAASKLRPDEEHNSTTTTTSAAGGNAHARVIDQDDHHHHKN